ncbi:LamG domain-containing protein [Myxococcota bacterium]|nr:LamG domain-containing protein [Myxococcota bacterium]MBU1413291.1 LamG domain-containing protein [Myxococcota bacterium]MBU1509982.1 LamG domain-containing protein [Myxococcota bacterium]
MYRAFLLLPWLLLGTLACTFDTAGLDKTGANNANNVNNIILNNVNNLNNLNNVTCGNGVLDTGEACDGADLAGATCVSLGYEGTGLACDAACQYDVSACDPPRTCGNGVLNPGERCDGTNLDGATCVSLGYYGTGLLCDELCQFDETACIANGRCGDDVINGPEECDGADLGAATCDTLGLGLGDLACGTGCVIDASACHLPELCGDGLDNDGDNDIDCLDADCASDLMCVNAMCTEFDTSTEHVQLGTLSELTGNNPVRAFSVSYWVKFNGTQPDWATPIGASTSGSWGDGFGFYHSSGDLIRFWINAYGTTRATSTTVIVNNVWYHVVGTFDADATSGNIKIYLNGVLEGQGDLKAAVTAPNAPVTIGSLIDDDMVGFIDEVGFWSLALTDRNVNAIYNGGSPASLLTDYGNYNQSATLTAYYRMGDGDTLPTIADHAGSHPGTLIDGEGDELVNDSP